MKTKQQVKKPSERVCEIQTEQWKAYSERFSEALNLAVIHFAPAILAYMDELWEMEQEELLLAKSITLNLNKYL